MKIERKEIRTDLKRRWENCVDVVIVFRMDFMKSGRKDRWQERKSRPDLKIYQGVGLEIRHFWNNFQMLWKSWGIVQFNRTEDGRKFPLSSFSFVWKDFLFIFALNWVIWSTGSWLNILVMVYGFLLQSFSDQAGFLAVLEWEW